MFKAIKQKLKNFIVNTIFSLDNETKFKLYNSLFAAAVTGTYNAYRKKYSIADTFRFNGIHIFLYGDGKITLGEDSYIGDYSTIQSSQGAQVSVGKRCSISHNVRIYTSSNVADQDFSGPNLAVKTKDVVIGDFVWIGANVFINPGVTIGNNSVVGANSVVVSDIPENSVYGGVPAKFIKTKVAEKNQ
jgi:maltose O-acetyltransferase